MYQMQRYGYIERPANFNYPLPGGGLYLLANRMPHLGRIEIPNEGLRPFDRVWLECFEFPVLYSTIRAERVGFPLDQKFLRKVRKRMERDLEKYLRQIYRYAGRKINLNSEKDIRWLFTKLKIRNPYKTPKGKMAINKNVLPRLITAHPVIQLLINRKKIQTLLDFYFGSLKKDGTAKDRGLAYFVNPTDGRIHATLSTVGAVTGRHSCSNPNLMQIPSRADIYEIKRAFVAPGRETR
jgi:DNA polymerase-1